MSESLQEVKDKLVTLGISTATPGLKGEERRQELLNRLEDAQMREKRDEKEDKNDRREKGFKGEIKDSEGKASIFNVPSFSDLSLSEIRSRLEMLGENTSTPGLSGEERRNELLKRLMNSICRSEETGDQMIDDLTQDPKPNRQESSQEIVSDSVKTPTETPSTFLFLPSELSEDNEMSDRTLSRREQMQKDERIKNTELNEVKKHLNQLLNQRAKRISSRYEGVQQDDRLKKLNTNQIELENEVIRIQSIHKKNKSGKVISSSSPFVENNNQMSTERILTKLNKELETIKEKVKRQKIKIKCEEEADEVYGLEAEEADKSRIQELNYEITKLKRDIEKMNVGVSVSNSYSILEREASVLPSSIQKNAKVQEEDQLETNRSEILPIQKTEKNQQPKLKNPKNSSNSTIDIGLSEEELQSLKPFQPYTDEGDDLLSLKMEMLRNRSKSSLVKATVNVNSTKGLPNDTPDSISPKKEKLSPSNDFGGSEVTAFSSRRQGNRNLTPSSSFHEEKSVSALAEGKIRSSQIESEVKIEKDEKLSDEVIFQIPHLSRLPPEPQPDEKIIRLRQEMAQLENDSDEENEESDGEEVDIQLKDLRKEAILLERANNFDGVEEIYVKALNLKPFDVPTLDSFATFLHRKKGELGRAEAFYRRAIQTCLPSLIDDLTSPTVKKAQIDWHKILDGNFVPPSPGSDSLPDGRASVPMKRLSSVLLHYATFLRRATGDVALAELVLRKAAEISPTDSLVLGSCAHFLAEESYGHTDQVDRETIQLYRNEAADLFRRAMKLNPSNVNNMLWYAKFLHKTNQIGQAEVMFKAALMSSKGEGKVGATTICNYAIFLYRHKKDPEEAARLFCEGIEKFPTHRGIQKNYKAMKRELEKAMAIAQSKLPRITEQPLSVEEEHQRGGSAHLSSRMAGLRAKLYHDVQSADDYKLPLNQKKVEEREIPQEEEEEEDDGMLNLSLQQLTIEPHHPDLTESTAGIYWLMNAGSGSISDRSYESSVCVCTTSSLQWDYNSSHSDKEPLPMVTVTYADHLCFEFYLLKNEEREPRDVNKGQFVGSVILPIEDIIHSTSTLNQTIKREKQIHNVEETIMSDAGEDIGQLHLQLSFL